MQSDQSHHRLHSFFYGAHLFLALNTRLFHPSCIALNPPIAYILGLTLSPLKPVLYAECHRFIFRKDVSPPNHISMKFVKIAAPINWALKSGVSFVQVRDVQLGLHLKAYR